MPTINMKKTGDNIKVLMKKNGLTVADLQNIFGFNTPNTIYRWCAGQNLPTIDNAVILAAIFNTTINDILVLD